VALITHKAVWVEVCVSFPVYVISLRTLAQCESIYEAGAVYYKYSYLLGL